MFVFLWLRAAWPLSSHPYIHRYIYICCSMPDVAAVCLPACHRQRICSQVKMAQRSLSTPAKYSGELHKYEWNWKWKWKVHYLFPLWCYPLASVVIKVEEEASINNIWSLLGKLLWWIDKEKSWILNKIVFSSNFF